MDFLGCKACRHFNPIDTTCKAFPSGIPFVFASGQHHDSVVDGQAGEFVYDAIDEAIANFAKAPKKIINQWGDTKDPIVLKIFGDDLTRLKDQPKKPAKEKAKAKKPAKKGDSDPIGVALDSLFN